MRRFIIGGTNSGCGKTTVTCAVLAALKKSGLSVAAFKCGPDYIDTMFHRKVIGVGSHNLDSFFCGRDTLLHLLDEYGKGIDIAVIEGVMGFYDSTVGSAHSVSELTETPAVIVIDCKGMSDSIGAVMSGFLRYRPNRIAGFIFNRLPEKLIPLAKRLCTELGTEYFGCLPKNDITIESRHLGLVTADEIADIQEKLSSLGNLAEKYICLDKLMNIVDSPIPEYKAPVILRFTEAPTIAAAQDSAFCFIYRENIELLEKMGCKIVYFSPISDKAVPKADGLLLYGGYPELYAARKPPILSWVYRYCVTFRFAPVRQPHFLFACNSGCGDQNAAFEARQSQTAGPMRHCGDLRCRSWNRMAYPAIALGKAPADFNAVQHPAGTALVCEGCASGDLEASLRFGLFGLLLQPGLLPARRVFGNERSQ